MAGSEEESKDPLLSLHFRLHHSTVCSNGHDQITVCDLYPWNPWVHKGTPPDRHRPRFPGTQLSLLPAWAVSTSIFLLCKVISCQIIFHSSQQQTFSAGRRPV